MPIFGDFFNKILDKYNEITELYVPAIEKRLTTDIDIELYNITRNLIQLRTNISRQLLDIINKLYKNEISLEELEKCYDIDDEWISFEYRNENIGETK